MLKRTDANQSEIVETLRDVTCDVFIASDIGRGFPDLVCGRAGQTFLIEVKPADGKLTPDQIEFSSGLAGPCCYSPDNR